MLVKHHGKILKHHGRIVHHRVHTGGNINHLIHKHHGGNITELKNQLKHLMIKQKPKKRIHF
jgi:transcriptional regulator with AAA-type ATPase domain